MTKDTDLRERLKGDSEIIEVKEGYIGIKGENHRERVGDEERKEVYLNRYIRDNPGDYLVSYNIRGYKGRRILLEGLDGYNKEVVFAIKEGIIEPRLQVPFKFEGWDKIIIEGKGVDKTPEEMLGEMEGYDQNNKYHTLTLDKHTKKAIKEFKKGYGEDKFIEDALKVHDYGKLYTRVEREDGGSSYYGHENVGAYKVLEHLGYREDKLELALMVQHHMQMGEDMSIKAKKKLESKVGEEGYTKLEKLKYGDTRGK